MMSAVNWPNLAILTLRDPKAAAAEIMAWQIPRDILWTGVVLVAIINTILSTVSDMLFPIPSPLDGIMANPLTLFAIAAVGFVATIYVLFWSGRLFGAKGGMDDLLVLLLWLQFLRAGAQVAVLVTLMVAPFLATILVLVIGIATIWIFLNFVNIGLHLNSMVRAVMVMGAGVIALALGLSMLFSLIGVDFIGVPSNV